ncbi:MAG TPA: toxin-antitoxin system YwqK family antitoxin [Clostridia bacterium]|nr:toxin-antitoxin system YwqK family antitoxin [Clostridia bacterium]
MSSPTPHRVVIRFAAIALFGVALAGLFWATRPQPKPAAEINRNLLVLHEGRLCLRDQTYPFTGFMVETNENGALLSRSAVSNGLLEGLSEGFYTNGQKQIAEHFRAGVSDGLRTKWHPNGRKLSEAAIVEGKLHGTFRRWFEDGALAEEIEINQGEPHGSARSYYPSGFLKVQARMEAGKMLEQKSWQDGEFRPASSDG